MKKNWFQNAVGYQIYPKSFMDSNHDGIGDIKGITQRLDYLQTLGVDLLWICPVCCSPMADNGYDISDYYHIDPTMGTDEDMDELIAEAKKRNIGIMMDMVLNHCSNQHPLFQKAYANPDGPEAQFFYFRKGKNGMPPNNWRCWFGGSAWEPVQNSDYYYLHVFTKQQPDLNWENPELRKRVYRMLNYWLDKGVVGFRMDAITDLKKQPFDAYMEPDGKDGLVAVGRWTENIEGIGDFLTEMRNETYGRVNAATVGEAGGVRSRENLREYISLENGYFSMIFDFCVSRINCGFYWHDVRNWTPEDFKCNVANACENAGDDCWYGIVLENHDQPRCIEHFLPKEGQNYFGASMLALYQMMRRGTPFIYQGQEIGMRNVQWESIEEYNDVSSHSQYKAAIDCGYNHQQAMSFVYNMSRDNSRTPFQWDGGENAGFSDVKPWLPVHKEYKQNNAEAQLANPKSLLQWYRKLIALRKSEDWGQVLSYGNEEHILDLQKNVIAYRRCYNGKSLLVLCNFQSCEVILSSVKTSGQVLLSNYEQTFADSCGICLKPFEAVILYEKSK